MKGNVSLRREYKVSLHVKSLQRPGVALLEIKIAGINGLICNPRLQSLAMGRDLYWEDFIGWALGDRNLTACRQILGLKE